MSDQSQNAEGPGGQENTGTSGDGAWREWTAVGVGLTGLLSIMALIVSVVALSSGNGSTTTTVVQAATPTSSSTPAPAPKSVSMVIKTDTQHAKKGSDGKWHDAFLGGNMTVRAGQTVNVTVSNHDTAPHSYTAPSLGLNETIAAGTDTTAHTAHFTFKAPSKPGTYQWWCALPCDPWAMSHDGYMRGHITVVS
jgi:plastocyanin